jgi:hypothetical protein
MDEIWKKLKLEWSNGTFACFFLIIYGKWICFFLYVNLSPSYVNLFLPKAKIIFCKIDDIEIFNKMLGK